MFTPYERGTILLILTLHVARLGAFDIDRPGERMGATTLQLLAKLEQHVQRRPRHEAIVEMHHCFHDDAVAGLDGEHRLLRIVVPAQLGGLHGRGEQMDLSPRSGCSYDRLRRCRRGYAHKQCAGEYGQRCLGSRHFTLPRLCAETSLNL